LVPCSKTKPYRRSRSHRRFLGALEGLSGLERVHLVSVSSPIGLVPRELEDVPPARHYDIPVTGDWEESERAYVRNALAHLRASGSYRSVVVHLDPQEYAFLAADLPPSELVQWTLRDDRTTTNEAVTALRSAVAHALEKERPVQGGPLAVVREELEALASVQFGPDAARRLFQPPVRLSGRPWFQRVTDGRRDLATWREERGLFHLTVAGARRLWPGPPLAVEMDAGVNLEGDLFVPGVRRADESIRIGDAVVLVRDDHLAGVGEAALPGRLMTELSRGLAVRVRHREHAPTDSPMTEERSPSDTGPVV
jgi:archaeosine synthase alpha-subunit